MESIAYPQQPPVQVIYMPSPETAANHLIFGRGKSFGGLVGITLYVTSIAVWAYAWVLFTATVIELAHTKSIKETLKKFISLAVYPFVMIPMEIFYVLPYKYIYCPWSRYWNSHHFFGLIKDAVGGVVNIGEDVARGILDAFGLGFVADGVSWTVHEVESVVSWSVDEVEKAWNWMFGNDPPPEDPVQKAHDEEVAKQAALDLAVGKYCTTSTMPVSKGCMGRKELSSSMFSAAHYFCDINQRTRNCSTNCGK